MGQALIVGRGGNGLTFGVVGGIIRPTSARENTIWVETSTAIPQGGFALSISEPEQAFGCVWITQATNSSVAFNAVKKGSLMTYPHGVYQWDGAKWNARGADIYKSGAWISIKLMLYAAGEEYIGTTGGWMPSTIYNRQNVFDTRGMQGEQSVLTREKRSEFMMLNARSVINGEIANASFCTRQKINLSPYKTLQANIHSIVGNASVSIAATLPTRGGVKTMNLVNGSNILDITSLIGEYYIIIGVAAYHASLTDTAACTIHEVLVY